MLRSRFVVAIAVGAVFLGAISVVGRVARRNAPMTVPSEHLLFNGWGLSPVGDPVKIGDMPLKMIFSPDGKQIVASTLGFSGVHVSTIDVSSNAVIQTTDLDRVWNGLAFSADGHTLYVGGGNSGKILSYRYDAGRLTKLQEVSAPPGAFVSGIAVQPHTGTIYVCDEAANQLYAYGPDLQFKASIRTGSNPYTCVFGEDSRYVYVSNWGSKSVAVVDTTTNTHLEDIRVGVRPNDMALGPDGRLFVACAGDNTVHVLQTRSPEVAVNGPTRATRPPEGVREILNTCLDPTSLEGSSPVAVAVSPNGKTLFVGNADNNDVLDADISNPNASVVRGFIPTGWYPTAVLATDVNMYVAVGKGLKSRPNFPALLADPSVGRQGQKYDYTGSCFEGYVSRVDVSDDSKLAGWTQLVRNNTPFHLANIDEANRELPGHAPNGGGAQAGPSVVPTNDRVGSPIKHVLYVIMENRTYDQVFGDLKQGNGDPELCMYGRKITPNRHALAESYTLLDNIYCNSEVSYDGHSWCDAAVATDAMQKQWTSGYSDHGDVTNSEDLQAPAAGFIWNSAMRHGLDVKAYGEGDSDYLGGYAVPTFARGTWQGNRDKDRVDGWIKDLHEGERTGKWANLMVMSLGEDHTSGTRPGAFTPEACEASNDLGIGKIIEAASHSKFWSTTAIFFVEDDAQDGPDHIDAHRTFGLVVSPYVKRHFVDHTMYSQVSMVRTIELLLALPPLTQYDAAAVPMFAVFGKHAVETPYHALPELVDLEAKNTARSPGALQSSRMDFSEYDRAPADELNHILWAEAKGPDVPYPAMHRTYLR